ncbi:hypothetical protein NBRC116602_30030 [Hyphomicrobiales bacterium 4NK60-0047b]
MTSTIEAFALDTENRTKFEDALSERNKGLLAKCLGEVNVLIVGCGSVGSYMAEKLIRAGVGEMTLIDPDEVESHNLTRTTYKYNDIGTLKVEALSAHLKAINPWCSSKVESEKFEAVSKQKIKDYVQASSLIICGADDKVTQGILNRIASYHDKPMIVPGLYQGAKGGEVVMVLPGITPCLECTVGGRSFTATQTEETIGRQTDYGTGRLEGEIALGCDVHHVAGIASKIALSLLSLMSGDEVEMSKFILRPLQDKTNYLTLGMTPDYWLFGEVFQEVPGQYAYQSLWIQAHTNANCSVCGDRKLGLDPIDEIATEVDEESLSTQFGDMTNELA